VSQDALSSTWLCTKTNNPPDRQGAPVALVAVLVPLAHVTWLDPAVATGQAFERNREWPKPVPVVPS
jgi:hypothetical protein